MSLNKYMTILTTCSVFAALISIIWEAFLLLNQLNDVTKLLTGLLAIEGSLKRSLNDTPPRVAVGYGACTDLQISGPQFLNYSNQLVKDVGEDFVVNDITDEQELLQTFGYYFRKGAAAERNMPNSTLFKSLISIAKSRHRNDIQWFIGGNAPLMGIRFQTEGAEVLLGARMSHKLRKLVPTEIQLAGDQIEEDDIHLILEYKTGETWGPFTAPRANRFILHNDQNNPHLNSVEQFTAAVKDFQPRLLVISGLQMMDMHKFEPGVRESRLEKVKEQVSSQSEATLQHFEMASYVEKELLDLLREHILPHVDSIGMNEQELENVSQTLEFGRVSMASAWNPRVAKTLDQMRKVFSLLAKDYYRHQALQPKRRLISRIHVHTLAYQAVLTTKGGLWKNTKAAAAKAALTAHRYVCQTDSVNPSSASLILDESFATSAEKSAGRVTISPQNPVPCWNEFIDIPSSQPIEVEICVAPVLVCRVAKKTAGAGDNISAAGLFQQL